MSNCIQLLNLVILLSCRNLIILHNTTRIDTHLSSPLVRIIKIIHKSLIYNGKYNTFRGYPKGKRGQNWGSSSILGIRVGKRSGAILAKAVPGVFMLALDPFPITPRQFAVGAVNQNTKILGSLENSVRFKGDD